jgi:phospholipase/carboxylesterase
VILGAYGPDVHFIDVALAVAFERIAVDPARLAVAGFSDGASYALSIGLTNGELFRHIMAFSPGFAAPAALEGRPRIFVSHGIRDQVLHIDLTSREVVPRLERSGYDIRYEEFDGPHTVPPDVARDALGWFLGDSAAPTAGEASATAQPSQ